MIDKAADRVAAEATRYKALVREPATKEEIERMADVVAYDLGITRGSVKWQKLAQLCASGFQLGHALAEVHGGE